MNILRSKLSTYIIPIIIIVIYFCLCLATINDFGVTWDFTDRINAGLWHLRLPLTVKNYTMLSWGPFSSIPSVVTYLIFFKFSHLFSFDAAYNLFSIIMGTVGIAVIYLFAKKLFGSLIALFSALTLALTPRYFGHLHSNMKDIPQAVFFTASLYFCYRLIEKPDLKKLFLATVSFAVAFNTKFNVLFVLPIGFAWWFFRRKIQHRIPLSRHFFLLYLILAPLVSYLLWSLFWLNPWERLLDLISSSVTTTTAMPVLYFGNLYMSGQNIPWHYPYGMLLAITPAPIIFFFLIGLFILLKKMPENSNYLFLFLWFVIPLLRFFKPGMIVIDDIRHFMEVIFPFSIIAGVGFTHFLKKISHMFHHVSFIFSCVYICYLILQVSSVHPYQTSYFSEWLGGIKGAQGKFDIEFWAGSYKQAMQYLNQNARNNAKITVAMAPDIAKLYLRPDLSDTVNENNLTKANSQIYNESDYTVILNRESFFNWYNIYPYLKSNKPVYSLIIREVPLVYIFQNNRNENNVINKPK